jgi:hypothetical protein
MPAKAATGQALNFEMAFAKGEPDRRQILRVL